VGGSAAHAFNYTVNRYEQAVHALFERAVGEADHPTKALNAHEEKGG